MRSYGETRWIHVTVPIASFAIPNSREYVESYPFPPPATVYGMLLSYIGEVNRFRYAGTRIAVIVHGMATPSIVLRKIRRFKQIEIDHKENSKPDYNTLLTGLKFTVGVRDSETQGIPSLIDALEQAYFHPGGTSRFGGLSCGESHNLVDRLSLVWNVTLSGEDWLVRPDSSGEWTISLWPDHVGSASSRVVGASFEPFEEDEGVLSDDLFFTVSPGEVNSRI